MMQHQGNIAAYLGNQIERVIRAPESCTRTPFTTIQFCLRISIPTIRWGITYTD